MRIYYLSVNQTEAVRSDVGMCVRMYIRKDHPE